MRIKSISLNGYRGVSFEPGLLLNDLGNYNIFIGPNNGGKSTVFRFLHFLRSMILSESLNNLFCLQDNVNGDNWWMQEKNKGVSAKISFSGLPVGLVIGKDILEKLAPNGDWSIYISLHNQPDGKTCLLTSPVVNEGDKLYPVVQLDSSTEKVVHLNAKNEYISSHAKDSCPYHQQTSNILKAWAQSVRFFDPVRAVDRGSGSRGMDDGANLLSKLFEQQQDPLKTALHSRFAEKLADYINKLMQTGAQTKGSFESFQLKGTSEKPQMYLKESGISGPPIALENMGTGISELVILISTLVNDLINDPNRPLQYFIEEPELHLHPGLLRRFLNLLRDFSKIQFFISSHSNVVLDSFCKDQDRVFLFSQDENGACIAVPCVKLIEQHQILDSLGMTGSSLLQANCIIWIEGPSDRLYIRHWLSYVNPELCEGSDYAFAFYGGKLLYHLSFEMDNDTETLQDFLSMIEVCRFSAVIMDKDIAPNEPLDAIRETKKRIEVESKNDPMHRLALFSNGREIENDIPIEIIRKAIKELTDQPDETIQNITLSGNMRYPEEIVRQLCLSDEESRELKRKLENKVTFARKVLLAFIDSGYELSKSEIPQYISELAQFISSSRL